MDPDSPRSPLDEGEIADDESREFDDGFDENLMGDEDDKKKLAQMTEKEREQELFNRSERRETLRIRFEIERKLRSKARKREQEKRTVQSRRKLKASEIYSDESSEESDEYRPETNRSSALNSTSQSGTRMNTRSALLITSSSSSSSSAEASASSSSESEQENHGFVTDEGSQTVQDSFEMTLADLKCLQLKRDKIEQWVYAPFFKETAIGLFVKISVSNYNNASTPMYKLGQIVDITKREMIYALNEGKTKTDKHCLVRIGRTERTYEMSFVSNRSFDEDDYHRWITQAHSDGQDTPSREFFNKKKRDLHKAINYEYTDEDIVYEVTERSRFKDHPFNFALKKTELMGEKADAEASNDYERARQLQQTIDELEEKSKQLEKSRSSSTFSAISFVNERNRYKNIVESERALKESKRVKTDDPFTRRKCTPSIVHNKNNGDSAAKGLNDKNGQDTPKLTSFDSNNTNTNGNKSVSKPERVDSVDDLFQAHANIDVDINLEDDL